MSTKSQGTTDVMDLHVKTVLEQMWQHGVSHHDALLVMKFLIELEDVPDCGKTIHKNFIVVFFHLMTYAVYCTEKNIVATTLTEKVVGNNGKKNFYKHMKKFYETLTAAREDERGHYESILITMYINAVDSNANAIFKIEKKQVMKKTSVTIVENLKTDWSQKERRGMWYDENDFNSKLMFSKHIEILSWAGLSE